MKKIIIIIFILLIPGILFADCAWLLWKNYQGNWLLTNALNSRNECLDALWEEHQWYYTRYYESSKDSPDYVVFPKLEDNKRHYVIHGIKSRITVQKTDETIRQMIKEGKTLEEIATYVRVSNKKELLSTSETSFWCLPVGVDPKTMGW